MNCCICNRPIERDDAPVLTYGLYGNARCLCDGCDACLTALTRGREPADIRAAMDELSERRLGMDERDRATQSVLSTLVDGAARRLEAIEAGTFDFTAEEAEDETYEDVPEELRETEEEQEAERQREEREHATDRVFSYIWAAVMALVLGAMIYFLFFR